MPIEIRLLGPLEVLVDGRPVGLGTTQQRALLAMLALHAGTAVRVVTSRSVV
jgi:DNA-binding SARP family transcriptional activator